MVAIIIVVILIISLSITSFLGVFTALYCESTKKNYFLLLVFSVFLFVLGYLLEVTAGDTDGGLTATKVMYIGATFISPAYLLFTADYCEINIRKNYIQLPLILLAIFINVLVWMAPVNKLLYNSYEYAADAIVPHLHITPGPLYYLNHGLSLVCIVSTASMILFRMKSWDKRYRFQLLLVLVGSLTPLLANLLYIFQLDINEYGINYTPLSLVLVNSMFYVAVVRYDIFNFLSKASAMALYSIKEAFILIDADMSFLNANPSAYKVFPELEHIKKGTSMLGISSWPKEMAKLSVDSQIQEIKFSQYREESKYYNASVNPVIVNKRLVGWVLLIQDVTSAHLLNMKLKESATLDVLTGIFNRRHFMEIIDMHILKAHRTSTPCYLVMLDIDFFKEVNDMYGHQTGDRVLIHFAKTIKNAIRAYDIFARYGGEEFVVFFEGDKNTVSMLTERIRLAVLENQYRDDDKSIGITVSIGAAAIDEGMSIDQAIEKADMGLYKAKSIGRNRIVFFDDIERY